MSNNPVPLVGRTPIQAVVKRNLPEHIREDYPTFVAFVEAYYEYLQTQGVDYKTVRDIDLTLDSFVEQFKKELAYNLPNVSQDKRFLLQNIKDQYLAKGSEASYRLLFKLLFEKEVELIYPGRSMLIPSDGRWSQEISVIARVDFGNPDDIVGKLVDIETSDRVIKVVIDRRQDIEDDENRLALIDPNKNIHEFLLDKKFVGNVSAGDKIIFNDQFQATILPLTQKLKIVQRGKNFRIGQVFEVRSGSGTTALVKVTAITPDGGIKYAEIIKFGIGYTADFAASVLATNSVNSTAITRLTSSSTVLQQNTYIADGSGTIVADPESFTVTGTSTSFGSAGEPIVGDEIWTNEVVPKFVGIIKSVSGLESITLVNKPSAYVNSISSSYTGTYTFRNSRSIGSLYAPDGTQAKTFKSTLADRTLGFDEQGYINAGDWVVSNYIDSTYAGTVIREFSLSYRNAQSESDEPAILELGLGTIAKYPGYFETNNGFLDDSIYIQDSRYYQVFSYVVKIDERLASYSSAVKTLIHPAGMALFGEFNITNNYDLSVSLQSLVNSLGISLQSFQSLSDSVLLNTTKNIVTTVNLPLDDNIKYSAIKSLSEPVQVDQQIAKNFMTSKTDLITVNDTFSIGAVNNRQFSESIIVNQVLGKSIFKDFTEEMILDDSINVSVVFLEEPIDIVTTSENTLLFDVDMRLTEDSKILDEIRIDTESVKLFSTQYSGIIDSITSITADYGRILQDSQSVNTLNVSKETTKYVTTILNPQRETGYVGLNPYAGQDYFATEYSVGSRESTFTTP